MNNCVTRFYVRKGEGNRTEHLQLKIGHVERMKNIKREMKGWMESKGVDVFPNMLQTERFKESEFFSNSYVTMGLEGMKDFTEKKT